MLPARFRSNITWLWVMSVNKLDMNLIYKDLITEIDDKKDWNALLKL